MTYTHLGGDPFKQRNRIGVHRHREKARVAGMRGEEKKSPEEVRGKIIEKSLGCILTAVGLHGRVLIRSDDIQFLRITP